MIKKRVKIGRRIVREDCAANDCHDPQCDVCHLHDEPADIETGMCEACESSINGAAEAHARKGGGGK